MITHFYEIFGFMVLAVFAIVVRWFVNLLGQWLDMENRIRTLEILDRIVEDAVMVTEEKENAPVLDKKTHGNKKRDSALQAIQLMMDDLKINAPLFVILVKIDATVYRLFHYDRE